MSTPQPSRGPKAIRDSIERLRERTSAWKRDELDKAGGWQILYAVDADVVLMYTSPQRSIGYGRVFDTDNQHTAEFLAHLLSDAIFFPESQNNSETMPPRRLFVIPPHDDELNNVMQSVAWNAREGLRGLQAKGVEDYEGLFKIISSYSGDDLDRLAGRLKEHAKDVLDLCKRITGSLTTMDRFVNLSDKLLNIWNARLDGEYVISEEESAVRLDTLTARRMWYQSLFAKRERQKQSGWEKRTGDNRTKDKDREADQDKADADAQVLATLDHLNCALFDDKIKILLVTGTSSIFEVGKKYRPLIAEKTGSKRNFADEYLRHPHWIMSDAHFFDFVRKDKTNRGNTTLDRWLRILSPDAAADKEPEESQFERDGLGDELENIPETWSSLVELLTTAKYGSESVEAGLDSSGESDLLFRLRSLARTGNLNKQSFLDIFEAPVTESISRLYLSSALISLLESAAVIKKPSRLMPALVFDPPYKGYNRYYTELIELFDPSLEFAERRNKVAQIRDLNKKINHSPFDPSLYHSHVIHAAAFAAIDFWDPAATLCTLAIRIASGLIRDDRDGKEQRRGREAAFLAAILARRRAVRDEDLNAARDYLKLAVSRQDGLRKSKDLRFTSEELVLELRELYFGFFAPEKLPQITESEFIREVSHRMTGLRGIVREVQAKDLGYDDPEAESRVKAWVGRQALTNLFEAGILLYSFDQALIFELEEEFRIFLNSIAVSDERRDPHAWLICRIAGLVLRHDSSEINRLSASSVGKNIGRFPQTARYEMKRNDLLRRALAKSKSEKPLKMLNSV